MKNKAVVIFSGGQDSTTCLKWASNRYDEVVAISFIYGQKHKIEIEQAIKITDKLKVEHHVIDISFFGDLVDSALTHNGDVNAPHPRLNDLPASFVPNRNAVFITLAHSLAQKIGAETLVTGVCETDFSGYLDCRQVFIDSIEVTLSLSSVHIDIVTPLMWLNKKQTWELAEAEGCVDIVRDLTITCYNGCTDKNEWGMGCGECPSCKLRKRGYNEYMASK